MIDRGAQFITFVLGVLFIAWIVYRGAAGLGYNWQWYRIPQYIYKVIDGELIWGPLIRGLLVTLEISLYAAVLMIIIGLVTTLLRLSNSFSGNLLATVYLEVIRNTPLLVQMFVFYFVIGPIFEIDRFWVAVLGLAFCRRNHPRRYSVSAKRPMGSSAFDWTWTSRHLSTRGLTAGCTDHATANDRVAGQSDKELRHCQRHCGLRSDDRGAEYYRRYLSEF